MRPISVFKEFLLHSSFLFKICVFSSIKAPWNNIKGSFSVWTEPLLLNLLKRVPWWVLMQPWFVENAIFSIFYSKFPVGLFLRSRRQIERSFFFLPFSLRLSPFPGGSGGIPHCIKGDRDSSIFSNIYANDIEK